MGHASAADAVDGFYNEVEYYDFSRPRFAKATGHFTQVVWRGTQRLGIGEAITPSGRPVHVFRYYPPGNYDGQFAANVPPSSEAQPGFETALAGPQPAGKCHSSSAQQGGFRLYANCDSYGNDFEGCGPTWPAPSADLEAVRAIARRAERLGAAAFNSIGCIKRSVKPRLSDVSRNNGWHGPGAGLYVRDAAMPAGWLFLPQTDSFGQDIMKYEGKSVFEAAWLAEEHGAVAFNTWGYIKHSLANIRDKNCACMGGMRGLFVRI
ncbi:hypothetical protein HYH03_014092 [Edaphochlamys debaryana]|uniref:SCP domain-containing protein n=1 Tax=Edaphochlamys debaryana TaxID=47281 RepID=A0A835XUR9_9CHLO|nr:hypothetical protein HYH03_014092 [Edaphochlamys debaryana]|eukprot:KAG2487250.1 hypothetical protein HYH03_014092 [Edaphochlamys debaryana]